MSNGVASYTPVPTEYKGVVYRSKCEAMFARYLELENERRIARLSCFRPNNGILGAGSGGFIYEPWDLEVDGWKPDFLVWNSLVRNDNEHRTLPSLGYAIIEYKPSRPTATYVKKFFDKCFRIYTFYKEQYGCNVAYSTDFTLYYGSCFNEDRGIYDTSVIGRDELSYYHHPVDWLSGFEDEIKSTRFDLEDK